MIPYKGYEIVEGHSCFMITKGKGSSVLASFMKFDDAKRCTDEGKAEFFLNNTNKYWDFKYGR